MARRIAIVGAGISGLTCAAVLRERGYEPHVFADKDAEHSTSEAAAAIWFPYDAGPEELAVAWGMITYGRLLDLLDDRDAGVSLVEFRTFSRTEHITPPVWTKALGARHLEQDEILTPYKSGYTMHVPLMDANIYLPYLRGRIGEITYGVKFERLEHVARDFDIIINCTGFNARALVDDEAELEAHRGQVAVVEPVELPYAFACDEEPLTAKHSRVGLRPYRKSGVRIDAGILSDGRRVIHNYGHGGAGFSLSWGCAHKVAELLATGTSSPRSTTRH